ncbi:ssDNA exonuclease RecJ [Gallibacterium salpingitidis]|uniref:single-stranded-DNA-specific exonuclease RecJ n=1 Tax=Gallibacterium salpingitidis TaxID=505341 RepID=UPI0008050DFF|nr:single-stranded-DNA-specific exonuclease RecJ [Gallibacterium salpingitidis]OBX07351.1 ssDNA exonuclease RecJ [Gallibacterium salpingitidis]
MLKRIERRALAEGVAVCDDPLLDRIYRSRGIATVQHLNYALKFMLSPSLLSHLERATKLLIEAYQQQKNIVIVGDFDADGATSIALTVLALRQLGFQSVDYLVPDRFEQGYGLSVSVAQQALQKQAELVITVDNGVSSLEGIDYLKQHQVQVIVTDHHLPGERLPNADVIVNPNLRDCGFPSKYLAGVGVAFYLMVALRAAFREHNLFADRAEPNFAELLDLVALGTVADVVPLDYNNRILVSQGLARIRAEHCHCGIRALIEVANLDITQLVASNLGFSIAPRLNAAGRIDNMSLGVELLLAETMEQARALALELDTLNQTRKEIETSMKQEALHFLRELKSTYQQDTFAIALYQPDWHQGVLGILAARMKDQFHRPTVVFAQEEQGILRGSARSIEGLHIRDLLEYIHSQYPEIIIKFGGHAMAAGLSINEAYFPKFQQLFNQYAKAWLDEKALQGVIYTDGELNSQEMNVATAEKLQFAGPWGQHFPEPQFDGEFRILQQRIVGEKHLKMLVEPLAGGNMFDAIQFNADTRLYPDLSIKSARMVYHLAVNEYRGNRQVQLLVNYIEALG